LDLENLKFDKEITARPVISSANIVFIRRPGSRLE